MAWCTGKSLLLALGIFGLAACEQSPVELPYDASNAASKSRARLLTAQQYLNAIGDVFGEDVAASLVSPMPPMQRTDGLLASGAASAGLTSDQISQIQQAAATIAAMVVDDEHRDFLIPCSPHSPAQPDADCASRFLGATGRLLLRRPLSEARLNELVELASDAAEQTSDFFDGLALALESVLISPDFLFIVDQTEADPNQAGSQRLDAYSLASRLSFFLWNGPPDPALLDAAERGELFDSRKRTAAVDRLLASPRLHEGMRAFFDDMLAFDDFDSLAKDSMVYPMVTAATLADAREQTLLTVIDHLLTREADYRDLFTTRKTFISMSLAAVYGTSADRAWMPYEFPQDGPRQGLLTHMSFLAAHSHSVRSSPTLRGKAMRELLLCQHVPDPPPNVDFSGLEDAEGAATARERLQVHNSNPSCAGCHLITDPMGLSLENFDGAGAFRDTEDGAELDIRGELDGVFYDDIKGLAVAMRNHPKLSYCLVNRLYAYATGGPVSLRDDRDTLRWFEERFAAGEYRLPVLLRELGLSKVFSTVRGGDEQTLLASAAAEVVDDTAGSGQTTTNNADPSVRDFLMPPATATFISATAAGTAAEPGANR